MTRLERIYHDVMPLLLACKKEEGYIKVYSKPYMPLVVEEIGENIFSFAHYYEQNGDLMKDPEITFQVLPFGIVKVLTYEMSYPSVFQEVYFTQDGKEFYRPGLKKELEKFLADWIKNLKDQGFYDKI